MNYKALYRTYRPSSFDEVVGQQHIVLTLKNAVKQNKIAHAYLFCGPRGTGKTSIAKLLAKAVNCVSPDNAPCDSCEQCLAIQVGNHPDIVEIDAASNNGVDEVRDLIEKVKYAPISGKYKVYIIDEVHMMSSGAFNALLKTLEEPPAHVIFILATTEPQKVLPTIISRCQRYDFTKVPSSEIVRKLNEVLASENIRCDAEAVRLIALLSDGGVRDALSILDQCIAYAQDEISAADVNEIYGITTIAEKIELLHWIFEKDAKELLSKTRVLSEKGTDIRRLTLDLMDVLKESLVYHYTRDTDLLLKLTDVEAVGLMTGRIPAEMLALLDILMSTYESYRNATNAGSYFEIALLKMISVIGEVAETTVMAANEPVVKAEKPLPQIISVESEPEAPLYETDVVPEAETSAVDEDTGYSTDYILQLLVSANKNAKAEASQKWQQIETKCRDMTWAKTANFFRGTSVAASGEQFILVAATYQAQANQINAADVQADIKNFLHQALAVRKQVFAVTADHFKEITAEFIKRKQEDDLPPPLQLDVLAEAEESSAESEKPEIKADPIEGRLISLFGSDQFEVVEEETAK